MSSCEKRAYNGEQVARREARRLTDETGEPFAAYPCPDCKRWHMSTNGGNTEAPKSHRGPVKHWPKRAHTVEQMEALAKAIRDRKTGGTHDPA